MVYWCTEVSLGYDQSNRWDIRDGGETDCSALVIHCLQEAGFTTGEASYTGNMRSALTANGWTVVANNGSPQTGDILLNDVNHVAVYIGNGKLAQASGDENGQISGGQAGDQTGRETNVSSYYNYPWDCYLRWSGGDDSGSSSNNQTNKGEIEMYLINTIDTKTWYVSNGVQCKWIKTERVLRNYQNEFGKLNLPVDKMYSTELYNEFAQDKILK
ncbi:NlpC/P60 family protein [Lactococcus protaetiae]|uniref:NlpC/P60 family protein n=2 Tax=Lactococcus protaetiae TaxID=2592653 RepID=A0A514ZBK5_9LACT|nr:NlpC/P60 family protein [Lactococcus protaetiae]